MITSKIKSFSFKIKIRIKFLTIFLTIYFNHYNFYTLLQVMDKLRKVNF